jgi:hypothetical protein
MTPLQHTLLSAGHLGTRSYVVHQPFLSLGVIFKGLEGGSLKKPQVPESTRIQSHVQCFNWPLLLLEPFPQVGNIRHSMWTSGPYGMGGMALAS